MPNPFEQALARAERAWSGVMMNEWLIQHQPYAALLDEIPNMMGDAYRDDHRINGTQRTLTLFKSSGYRPKVGDKVTRGREKYLVRGFSFTDELIILQLE